MPKWLADVPSSAKTSIYILIGYKTESPLVPRLGGVSKGERFQKWPRQVQDFIARASFVPCRHIL